MIFSLIFVSIFFLCYLESLMVAILTLELMSFVLFYMAAIFLGASLTSNAFLILLFSVFVMGGVIGLSSLIVVVSFTGLDYLSSSSLLKC